MSQPASVPVLLLTVSQVAEALAIKKSLAYELIGSGKLKAIRLNSLLRVRPVDLAEFVNVLSGDTPEN